MRPAERTARPCANGCQSGTQGIEQRFAAQCKCSADDLEKERYVRHIHWRSFAYCTAQYGRGHFGLRREAVRRYIKQQFRLCIKLHVKRKSAVICSAREGANALGHFFLDHHSQSLETAAVDQRREDRVVML